MPIQTLVTNPATAATVAQRIEQASTAELAGHSAAVLASLALHPRSQEVALWLAYACAEDAELLTYLATLCYALGFSHALSVAAVITELQELVEADFGSLENFASLTEPLFDPQDSLVARMDAVRRFAGAGDGQTMAA
jgi:hypothetical protein